MHYALCIIIFLAHLVCFAHIYNMPLAGMALAPQMTKERLNAGSGKRNS